jgi:pterin-4a-carbinolamine dehydratase
MTTTARRVASLATRAGGLLVRRRRSAVTTSSAHQAGVQPTDLTAGEVSAELASLPRWTGDVHVLERFVAMPPGRAEELRERIARAEQALNHHAVIEERTEGTVFRVSTYMRDAVTDLDIALALKISDIIDGGGAAQTRP